MAQRATKLWLQKQFQTSGVLLDPEALEQLARVVQDEEDPEPFVHRLIDEIEDESTERRVTAEALEAALATLAGRSAGRDAVQVVDAFSVPRLEYDPVRKLFHAAPARPVLLADAKSKVQLYVDRYHLVAQRLRRSPIFRGARWARGGGGAAAAAGGAHELTELKAMLGLVGVPRCVCAFLTAGAAPGEFALEDLSARIPVDLTHAERSGGLFTANCVVVAEGELRADGVFAAASLGMPPPEPRAPAAAALQGLDAFGGRAPEPRDVAHWRAAHAGDRVVVLSDVWLDAPAVMARLAAVLRGFAGTARPPTLFVLVGPFQSAAAGGGAGAAAGAAAAGGGGGFARARERFAALGRLLGSFAALRAAGTRFVLVPGPGDAGPGRVLPRPPLPRALAGAAADALPPGALVLGSNPCRVRHGDRELVIFRDDLQRRLRGLAVLPPAAAEAALLALDGAGGGGGAAGAAAAAAAAPPLFEEACATVLQQSHLCPVPLEFQPVAWEWDHALRLYPPPHALVLADAAPAAAHEFAGTACLNPGSLAVDGTFGAWDPVANEVELCDVEGGGGEEEGGEGDGAAEGDEGDDADGAAPEGDEAGAEAQGPLGGLEALLA